MIRPGRQLRVHGVRYQTRDVGQVQLLDPDGNPIELFEPTSR